MKNEKLEWKEIKYAPGYYVNAIGEVKGKKTDKLKLQNGNLGFKIVGLTVISDDGSKKRQTAYVHKLVAEAFIARPLDGKRYVVKHLNDDLNDNTVSNLEWVEYGQRMIEIAAFARSRIGK